MSYELAFSPRNLAHNGKFHRLKVSLNPPIRGATVEARRGYFAPPPGISSASLDKRLAAAVSGRDAVAGLAMTMRTASGPGRISVAVSIAKADLAYTATNGRHAQKLAIVAGLFDAAGNFVTGERGEVDLALKSRTFKRIRSRRASPLRATLTLHAHPGAYRLRVVVLEASDGRLAADSRSVRIR